MNYVFLLKQIGEGCDYTIACGYDWWECEAENMDEAWQKFYDEEMEGFTGNLSLEYVFICEVNQMKRIDNPRYIEPKEDEEVERLWDDYFRARDRLIELGQHISVKSV